MRAFIFVAIYMTLWRHHVTAYSEIKSGSKVIIDNMIVRANGNIYRAFKSEQPSIFTVSKCGSGSARSTILGGMTVTLRDKANRTCNFDRNKNLKCSQKSLGDQECNMRILVKHGPEKTPIQFMSLVKIRMTNCSLDCGAENNTKPISCASRLQQPWYSFVIMPVS